MSFIRKNVGSSKKYAYSSLEFTMFSAPCVIISSSSSLLAAIQERKHDTNLEQEHYFTFGGLCAPLLDDELVEAQFLRCALQHSFFHTAFSDESEHIDLFCLSNTMCTVHCLQVRLRVPGENIVSTKP